jgi:hypothetical protein
MQAVEGSVAVEQEEAIAGEVRVAERRSENYY